MLKITALNNAGHRTLVVEGRLVDPWLVELERIWNETVGVRESQTVVVDLKDVTAISERGERLLLQMMVDGAKFNCCRGVLTRHVVERLVHWCAAHSGTQDVKG
jgi:hypothetical protein